jgi:hypothetical protein
MQRYAGSCSPEQLHTLQKNFDLIWMELWANGDCNFSGPKDPDALSDEIAHRATRYFNEGQNSDNITQLVLSSFGLGSAGLKLT